jgi:hypothetical protein
VNLDLASLGQHRDLSHRLGNFASPVADIAADAAADRPAKSHERFESTASLSHGEGDEIEEQSTAACGDAFTVALKGGERGGRETNDCTWDGIISDKQIMPTAKHPHGHFLRLAGREDGAEFIHGTGLDEKLRRSADLEVRVWRKRLIALRDFSKLLSKGHDNLLTSLACGQ